MQFQVYFNKLSRRTPRVKWSQLRNQPPEPDVLYYWVNKWGRTGSTGPVRLRVASRGWSVGLVKSWSKK